GRDAAFELLGRRTERLRVGVHEDGPAARVDDRCGGGEERVGGDENVTAGDGQRAQDDLERRGAPGDGDTVFELAMAPGLPLELGAVPPERQPPARQDLVDPLGDPATVLGGEVDPRGRDRPTLDRAVRCVLAASPNHRRPPAVVQPSSRAIVDLEPIARAGQREPTNRAKPSLGMIASSPLPNCTRARNRSTLTLRRDSALLPPRWGSAPRDERVRPGTGRP